jgi:excisionase family DNA binding protein
MHLTPQDLGTLRKIAIRAVNECHDVLAAAARTAQSERRSHEYRGRQGCDRPTAKVESPGAALGDSGSKASSPALVQKLAFSVAEAALALGLSETTVWRHRAEGRLEAFKLGGRTLIKAETLHAFIAEAEQG